jgi:iron complex outermembrane receptor protein
VKNQLPHSIMLFGASLCALQVNLAYGQGESDSNLEKVTVIGNHRAYRGEFQPLETPQAELTIDSEAIQNIGALDLTQALDLSSSVARQNNFGGLWNSFALRGFVGDENLPSNYLVNGFNAGRGFGGPRDLSGIESVEVLKGPRAALFGRGEPGGTINLVTKRAHFEKAGELKFSAGSFDMFRTDFDWNGPVTDEFAVRLVGFYEDSESFRDTVEINKRGVSPSIAWKISPNTYFSYELEASHQEIPFDRGVVAIDGELGLIPESRFLGEPGDGPMEADVLGHQLELQHEFNDDWSALLGYNFRDTRLEGFATENGFGGVDEEGNLGRFRRYRDYDANYQVLRAEINGSFNTGDLEHRVIVGVDTDRFENDQFFLRIRNRESNQEINVFNPVYGAYPLPTPNPNTDRVETQESTGVFIQDQIGLTDRLDIRIGARLDDYKQKLVNRRSDSVADQTESRLSPQFGVVYETSDSLSLYAAYGENFRPLSGSDANGQGHEPNQSTSVEAGLKFELNDGALSGTFAVFKVTQDNILVVDNVDTFTSAAIGEAESQGFEFDLTGDISDTLSIWASYTYVDAETKNEFFDPNFGYLVPAGSPLLNIPEQQLTLMLVNDLTAFGKPLALGGGLLHVGERNGYFGVDFDLPSYTTARAFASYELNNSVELRFEVDNLFDEEYYTNSFADVWVQPGTPRSVRLSAVFGF